MPSRPPRAAWRSAAATGLLLAACQAWAPPPRDSVPSVRRAVPRNEASYYKRPAAALERGGGFFIPGLKEQYKLKIFAAGIVAGALVVNRFPGYSASAPQLRSEVIGAASVALLVLQAGLEAWQAQNEASLAPDEEVVASGWVGGPVEGKLRSLVPWAAATMPLAAQDVVAVAFGQGKALRHLAGTFAGGSRPLAVLEGREQAGEAVEAVLRGAQDIAKGSASLTVDAMTLDASTAAMVPGTARSAVLVRHAGNDGQGLWWLVASRADVVAKDAVADILRGVVVDMDD